MRYTSLPASAQAAYADLLAGLREAAIPARGVSWFTRAVKGRRYWYAEHRVGARKRFRYIGPDTEAVRGRIEACRRKQRETQALKPALTRLSAVCAAAGLHTATPIETRVYEALAQAGLFEAGAVVAGTHAFLHIGNLLCVQWAEPSIWRTDDLDIARARGLSVAAQAPPRPIEDILRDADRGMTALPALNPKHPSTSFRFHRHSLTVSLLTPLLGAPGAAPVELKGLNAAAQPVRFLDYLLEDSQPAAVPGGRGGILIRVPHPGRFALHKLVVSQRRPPAESAKRRKDIAQAACVIDVLKDAQPGDLADAAQAAARIGGKFIRQLNAAARLLDGSAQAAVREAFAAAEAWPAGGTMAAPEV